MSGSQISLPCADAQIGNNEIKHIKNTILFMILPFHDHRSPQIARMISKSCRTVGEVARV